MLSVRNLDALTPRRGIVLTCGSGGQAYELTTIKKWIRVCLERFKSEKIDLLLHRGAMPLLADIVGYAEHVGVRVSPKYDPAECAPAEVAACAPGALDHAVCAVLDEDLRSLATGLRALADAGIPVRLELRAPFPDAWDSATLDEVFSLVAQIDLCPGSPWFKAARTQDAAALKQIDSLTRIAQQAIALGKDTNLLGLPFCAYPEAMWGHVVNDAQAALLPKYYQRIAVEFARDVARLRQHRLDKRLEVELGRGASFHGAIDRLVLEWINTTPGRYVRVWLLHKLTRHSRWRRRPPIDLPEESTTELHSAEEARRAGARTLTPACAECRLQRLCDHLTPEVREQFPWLKVSPVGGDPVSDPLVFSATRTHYVDEVDAARATHGERAQALADHARKLIADRPPSQEITSDSYVIENWLTHPMPGAVRWPSYYAHELLSTPLPNLEAPYALSVMFGGGIARQIGFAFGKNARIVCPMTGHIHRLVLYVAENGDYVLLRDGERVRPTEFEGQQLVPPRLPVLARPCISIINIDGQISTQSVQVWFEKDLPAPSATRPRYSVIIVSNFYARRLQAVLLSLVHQQGIALDEIEVLVAYVPGIDATDDLIDSLRATHPELHVHRMGFHPAKRRAKGFMINECVQHSRGEWILLLDSDILLPPDFFAQADALRANTHYIAPEGRKMLSPATTARILLGEATPWVEYDALLQTEGEERLFESDGMPPGFCQCVRRDVIESVNYVELDHFEGSDWCFSKDVKRFYGPETRLKGMRVLHLDHGGSQWYGATKQM